MEIDLTEFVKTYYIYFIFFVIIVGAILYQKYKRKKIPQAEPWIPPPPKEIREESKEEDRLYDVGNVPSKIKELEKTREQILSEAKRLKDGMEKNKEKLRKEMENVGKDGYYNSMILKMKKDEVENRIRFLKEFQGLPKK